MYKNKDFVISNIISIFGFIRERKIVKKYNGLPKKYLRKYVVVKGNRIPITYLPLSMIAKGTMFGAVCNINVAEEQDQVISIITDANYIASPKYVKEFVIAHEMGHLYGDYAYKMLHQNNINSILARFSNDGQSDEIAADLYAVRKIGKEKSIKAIEYIKTAMIFRQKYFKNKLPEELWSKAMTEINNRIENIQKV